MIIQRRVFRKLTICHVMFLMNIYVLIFYLFIYVCINVYHHLKTNKYSHLYYALFSFIIINEIMKTIIHKKQQKMLVSVVQRRPSS